MSAPVDGPVDGPGTSSPAGVSADEAEKLVTVKINGVEYRVDPEMAAALEEREKDFQRKLSEQAEALRRQAPQPTPPLPQLPKEDDNLDVLLFESPKEAINKLEQRIIKKVVAAYQADQGEREFWNAFYRENEDLAKHDRLARAILNERFNEWANLPATQARKNLASAVREEILSIVKAHSGESAPKRTFVEGGSAGTASVQRTAPPQPRSLSDMIAKRRQAHLKGATQ
jgi:predicted DNA-binding ribbon-helix-helix protein